MISFKVCILMLFAVTALKCDFVHCENEAKDTKTTTTTTTTSTSTKAPAAIAAETTTAQLTANNTRVARLLKVLQDPKVTAAKLYQRVVARADHASSGGVPPYRRAPPYAVAPGPHSPYHKARPPMMRRVQNGPPVNGAPTRYGFEPPKGGINQLTSKGSVPFNAGKVTIYRPPFAYAQPHPQSHPNALAPHFAAVKYQQQLQHEDFNFKASPPFNGKAIVRPLLEPHDPNYRQHLLQLQQYAGNPQQVVQQYPIPQQQPQPQSQLQSQQQQVNNHFSTQYQTQKQSSYRAPTFHYETMRTHEQPVLQPHVKHEHPPPGISGYAVYEHNELSEEEEKHHPYAHPHAYYPPTTKAEEFSQQLQSMRQEAQHSGADDASAQEAEEYIKFMNSNDYFLPKREPNYKRLDTQHEHHEIQHKQQRAQQQTTQPHHYPHAQHHMQYSKPAVSDSTSTGSGAIRAAATNYLDQPIKVSQLFYQEDPVPTIVRGSYQAGNNLFVVKSDGNKAVKHVVPLPSTRVPTTLAPAYSKVRYNTLRSRTPEPLRFEFTERDAVHSAFTNSPAAPQINAREHLHYRTASEVSSSTMPELPPSSTHNYGTGTATLSSADDPEDDEDVQSASSDFYGRMPVRQSTLADAASAPTSPAPVEQKDTEEYCERICANVQDEDEEIVCGSDGYMYTSEAQMECYATCLHIDVTMQSKGSCNSR